MQSFPFSDWVTSLNITHSRFNHFPVYFVISCFFKKLNDILLYICSRLSLSIHLLMDNLDCWFHFLAVVNRAAINI